MGKGRDECVACPQKGVCTPNYDIRQTDCKEGYMGNACVQCIQGSYYKTISGECRECPSISAGMVLAILLAVFVGYQVVASGILQKIIHLREIVIDCQITMALSIPAVPWPPVVSKWFSFFSAAAFDVAGFSSQSGCTTGGEGGAMWVLTWWAQVVGPLVCSLLPLLFMKFKQTMIRRATRKAEASKLSPAKKNILRVDRVGGCPVHAVNAL